MILKSSAGLFSLCCFVSGQIFQTSDGRVFTTAVDDQGQNGGSLFDQVKQQIPR
jgi:hypothetical protein